MLFCKASDITISEGDEYAPIVSSTSLTTISNGTLANSSNSFLRGDPEAKIIFSHIFLLPFSHEAEQFILIVSKE